MAIRIGDHCQRQHLQQRSNGQNKIKIWRHCDRDQPVQLRLIPDESLHFRARPSHCVAEPTRKVFNELLEVFVPHSNAGFMGQRPRTTPTRWRILLSSVEHAGRSIGLSRCYSLNNISCWSQRQLARYPEEVRNVRLWVWSCISI